MKQRHSLNQSQSQNFILSPEMKLALKVLELPAQELSDWIESESLDNPLIETSDVRQGFHPIDVVSEKSEERDPLKILSREIENHFVDPEEELIAKEIFYRINHLGFLCTSVELTAKMINHPLEKVIDIHNQIKNLEPKGSGSASLVEYLLFQTEDTIVNKILSEYIDLVKQRAFAKIQSKMKLSKDEFMAALKKIKKLKPSPFAEFDNLHTPYITADIILDYRDEKWHIEIPSHNTSFHLSGFYLSKLIDDDTPQDAKTTIRGYAKRGKWMLQIIARRKKNLQRLADILTKKQSKYLRGETKFPNLLTLSETAQTLDLTISTITRAVKDKWIDTPIGLIPIRSLFQISSQINGEARSSQEAKVLLQKLISSESKPLSDDELAILMKEKGFPCKRRTVSKYRAALGIPSSFKRKHLT